MTVEFDEQDGATLLRPLDRGPRGASTVDIAKAIADGDRHHRRVRLAGSAGAAATVVVVAVAGWTVVADGPQRTAPPEGAGQSGGAAGQSAGQSAGAGKGCVVQRLPVPAGEGEKGIVSGSDPSGRYILGRTYPDGRPSTVVWQGPQVRKVPMPGDDPVLSDATSTGVLVGSSLTKQDTSTAWVYRNGEFSKLVGADAQALAINEREVIVGSVQGRPAMWASPTAEPTMLATPVSGMTGQASGIDEDGTIVGTLGSGEATAGLGYVWSPDGTPRKLPQPSVRGNPAGMYNARTIRDGWVSGWAAYDEPNRGPRWIGTPRWNLRTGHLDTTDGLLTVLNAQGRLAGPSALVAPDGSTVPLPLPEGYDASTDSVDTRALSDDGTIVAGYVSARGGGMSYEPVAIVWRCGAT
ncbi:hypothetical protein AB0H83_31210 [Dactylosporangium sp. NPDC050688]|uniref:hypothetical protein n=1 Tax=Dactylosporangium sp. NPDC050688 TaxID=3157217 RepID=UPI003410C9E7